MASKLKEPQKQKRDAGGFSLRAAALEPASVNAEKRTVDLVWTTGVGVLRRDYKGPYMEELSTEASHVRLGRLNNGAPFLANHDKSDVARTLGVVENARLEGGKGVATIRFTPAGIDPDADMIFEKIRAGIIQNVSVGYQVHKAEEIAVPGKVPIYRATDWEPHEISAVTVGADDDAGFRSLSRGAEPQQEQRQMEKTPEQVAAEKAAEEKHAADLNRARADAADSARRGERDRVAGIQHAVRSAKLEDTLAQKMIDDGVELVKAREMVIDELARKSDSTPIQTAQSIVVGEEDRDKWVRGVTSAMLARSGKLTDIRVALAEHKAKAERLQNPDLLKAFKGFDPLEDGGELRSFSLLDLARESLERRGVKTRGLSSEKIVERAFYSRDNGGQQTSSDFSVALENVMYKTLLGAYAQASDTWRRFCGVDSVPDFRNSNRYRLGSFGTLDQMDESGEYKSKVIPDAVKQTISTATYGDKIALSRKAIINDDMGAVVASADRFGRMAGLTIEVAVYNLLALNSGLGPNVTYNGITAPLFDAQFANLGAGAALSADALVANHNVMASQKDISNNEVLDIRPNVLLVPLTLGANAKQINRATYDPTPGSAFEAPNKAAGMFRDIVDTPRLSGTRRYMFSDATPALLVVFLQGTQVPFLDQRPGWDIDGIEWKLRLDVNAQGFDPKGAVTDAGA